MDKIRIEHCKRENEYWMLYYGGTPYAKAYTKEAAEEIKKAVETMFPRKNTEHGPVYAWPRE